MPNPNTLQWLHYQDIQIPDATLRQQFRQYMQSNQYAQALAILTNNVEQLKGKSYVADTINTIINGIVNLEERYNTEVTVYLNNLLTQFDTLIEDLSKKGEWQSIIQYYPYNFVIYNNNIYMCIKKPPIGAFPTNTTYWLYLGLQGAEGSPGINVNMAFNWNSETPYQPNDLVVYQSNIYCAKIANTGIVPTNTNTWFLFLNIGEGKINIGVTPPNNTSDNMIWFETKTEPSLATDNTPIIGTFKRYDENTNIWNDMCPNILFTWIEGIGSYSQIKKTNDIIISIINWENNEWTYFDPNITENSIIEIWPNNLSNIQYVLYNNLSIIINNGFFTLKSSITPNIDLPIIITIQ